MGLAPSLRLLLGIATCVGVLVLAMVWDEVPAVFVQCSERLPEIPSDSGAVAGSYWIGTCLCSPGPIVLILKLVGTVLAVATAAVLATRAATTFRVTAGATAAVFCGLLGLQARHMVNAQVFDVGTFPSFRVAAIGACSLYIFGVLVGLATERWWPNTSLERARER
jgi:hypothetical protein